MFEKNSVESNYNQDFIGLVSQAVDLVEDNLTEPISIQDITQQFEQSHWHFQRLFRAIVGVSIGQYLRERRLSEAAVIIKNSPLRIIDVAFQFNFESQEAFARAFKKNFLLTPTDYRSKKNVILPNFRHRLTLDKINYFWHKIQRQPALVDLEQKIICGRSVEYKSHFVEGRDCVEKVLPHWTDFLKEIKFIPHQTNKKLYGVAISSELQMREEYLNYLSGVEVSSVSDSLEYSYLLLPAGQYASFRNIGLVTRLSALMDFIYGIWLPTSNFQRRKGYDFEIFDKKYSLSDENSASYYYLPIEPKS